jgi:hypothetical protein
VKRKGKEKKEEQREGVRAGFGSLLGWIGSRARPKLGCWLSLLNFFLISFLFLFFCFLNSFVSFAKMLQINSNHFQEFSKIQRIKVGQ